MAVKWKVKVCIVGDSAVGKTSLIRRFVLDQFDDRYIITLGAKVVTKEFDFSPPEGGEGISVSLLTWDIMGARGFKDLLQDAYFYNAQGVLAVCDLTRPETLESLKTWVSSVREVAGPVPCIALANKVDLKEKLAIPDDKIQKLCESMNVPYLKTSAKTGENVEIAFKWLVGAIHARSHDARGSAPRLGA
jgi:small GTP-binding protein